jgi:hypothetical protein
MRIDANSRISLATGFRASHDRQEPDQVLPGKNLVPVGSMVTAGNRHARPVRIPAEFVTQLIAKQQGAAHMRVRNRAEPAEAVQVYRKMLNLSGIPNRYKARPF